MNPRVTQLLSRHPALTACEEDLVAALDLLVACYIRDNVVYLCGNGGSAADCEHIVGELMKSFGRRRPLPADMAKKIADPRVADRLEGALRAVSLTAHTALATAFANDAAPDLVFAQQVHGYGRPGDVLWAISTSGNSINVLHAATVARARSMPVLGLTGQTGGKLAARCDVCVRVPETETCRVQELHLPVYHALCLALEDRFFPSA